MNDLDLVRDLRADVPSPTRERLAPGRARLLASVSRPSRPRYARRAVLPVAAAASAVAVAVAAASGAWSSPATRSAAVKPPAIRLTLTARLLSTAAATVAKHPVARPGPHQWFYTRFVGHDYGQPAQSNENWETFDGRRTAYFQNGRLIVHKTLGVFAGRGLTPWASTTPTPHRRLRTTRWHHCHRTPGHSWPSSPSSWPRSARAWRREVSSRCTRQGAATSSSSTTWPSCCGIRRPVNRPLPRLRCSGPWPPSRESAASRGSPTLSGGQRSGCPITAARHSFCSIRGPTR